MDAQTILLAASVSSSKSVRTTLWTILPSLEVALPAQILNFLREAQNYSDSVGAPLNSGIYSDLIEALPDLVDPNQVIWAVYELNNSQTQKRLSSLLLETMEVLSRGVQLGSIYRYGLQDALSHLRTSLDQIVPYGVIQSEVETDFLNVSTVASSLKTGLSVLDHHTTGIYDGDLWIWMAYTGHGKSFFLQNLFYNFRIFEGKSGVFVSTEQKYAQIEKRLCFRHSCHPKWGLPNGISSTAFKRQTLTGAELSLFVNEIVPDWRSSAYPGCKILVYPSGTKLVDIRMHLMKLYKAEPFDWVLLDYLSQLSPITPTGNERIDLKNAVLEAKSLALDLRPRGVPVITAAQTNPESYRTALEKGRYGLRSVAGSAEFERSADVLGWLLYSPEDEEQSLIRSGIVKYREGKAGLDFQLEAKFDSAFLGDYTVADSGSDSWSY
jgi:hypothetical protein